MKLLKDKRLFRDVDIKTLDPAKDHYYIITRVFDKGTWNNIGEIVRYYSMDEIKHALQWARWFDVKTIYFVSSYFDIPLEKMRSYRQLRESPPLWV